MTQPGRGLPELIQHLAVVGQKAVCCAQRGQRVGAQQDIELFRLGRCQHIHCHLRPAHAALDCAAVHNGIRANAGIAADERAAQVNAVIGKAHRQTVAQKGCVRKVAQVHLPAAGLADDAAVIRLDLVGPRCLSGGAELFQRDSRRIVGSTAYPLPYPSLLSATEAPVSPCMGSGARILAAVPAAGLCVDSLALLFAIFQNGRDGQRGSSRIATMIPASRRPVPALLRRLRPWVE